MRASPKYSLMIPARNGGAYLPTCIESITRQNFSDYELIVSDDHSTDGSDAFLAGLNHPNVRKVVPPEGLSMTEHWDWVASLACGEWLIFIGQDDGVQSYFFDLADYLCDLADQQGIRTVMSRRAYYFWPGCERLFGKTAVEFTAACKVSVRNCRRRAMASLLGFENYFVLPEMYTTALFRKALVDEARAAQNGALLVTHPQDANLAAIACSLEKRFLHSEIPLGWVGSSPKSAGMAISVAANRGTSHVDPELDNLRREYLDKVTRSKLPTHPLAGPFSFGANALYFWGALLQTKHLRSPKENQLLESGLFKVFMFAGVYLTVVKPADRCGLDKMSDFRQILAENRTALFHVKIAAFFLSILQKGFLIYRKSVLKLMKIFGKAVWFHQEHSSDSNIEMIPVSDAVKELLLSRAILHKNKVSPNG